MVEGGALSVDDVQALARAFRAHLDHLRSFSGLRYVGAEPLPHVDDVDDASRDTPSVETTPPIEMAPQVQPEPRPQPRPQPRPEPRPESRPVNSATSYARPEPVGTAAAEETRTPPPSTGATGRGTDRAQDWPAARKLDYLRTRNVGDCHRCPLSKTRRNIVFGVGNPDAALMFVGEAPGGEEDRLGEPFVGPAGRRLDAWLGQVGLRRQDVYIANVLKCRPPGNRDPQPAEIERCSPFLHAQIRAIQPKVLVALGRFAGCLLIGSELKLYEMRGRVHRYTEPKSGSAVPLVVTYHPSYVLRADKSPRGQQGQQGRPQPARPDRPSWINPEDEKVLSDLDRAVSLLRQGHGPVVS